jgi:hypothetical protein
MYNSKKGIVLFFGVFFLTFFSFYQIANAQAKKCKPCEQHWKYECDGNCPGILLDWWYEPCCTMRIWVKNSSQGESWQFCDAGAGAHYCSNICLPQPENLPKNPRWYDDPTKNNDASADKGNVNDTLPIVLDWEQVGWKDGGKYNSDGSLKLFAVPNYGVNSFYIEIDNPDNQLLHPEKVPNATYDTTKKILGKCVTNDFFNSRDDGLPCLFRTAKKDITYRVKACCTTDCKNCGPFVTWKFSTGDFPEMKAPLDPDWNGPKAVEGLAFKGLQVEWCKAWVTKKSPNDWAKSYQLMATSDEKGAGTQTCHPLLISNNQCRAENVLKDIVSGNIAETGEVTTKYPIQGRNDLALFTRDRLYAWKMKTCYDESSSSCSDYGQVWKFSTKHDPIGIPTLVTPANDPQGTQPVSLPVSLSATIPNGANSLIFEASFLNSDQKTTQNTVPNSGTPQSVKDLFDAPNLKADTEYKWRVMACSNFDSTDCDSYSSWFTFKTTGRAPKPESLSQTSGVPATFSWEAVPGAKSYVFSIFSSGTEVKSVILKDLALLSSPSYSLGYPDIDQSQSYKWKVRTCAHDDGTVCGAWSSEVNMDTTQLEKPKGKEPADNTTIYSRGLSQSLSWYSVPGATAYHYALVLVGSAGRPDCVQDTIERTVINPGDQTQLHCLGTYELTVHACLDVNCNSMGPANTWQFVLAQHLPGTKAALAVCGMGYDDPDTPWNERTTCEPKHVFLAAKVGLDFAIFKLAIWLLPILVLITGLIFYSSLKTPAIWQKVKTMWKYIAIGYGLLFLAWIIVGFILQIIGFPGLWWKIL